MEKQWTKKGLRLTTINSESIDGHRSFSSIGQNVDDQKISNCKNKLATSFKSTSLSS